ncbi:MAG: hypothetical protein ACREOJ_06290 [Gemmatimonadaceae bacterium]
MTLFGACAPKAPPLAGAVVPATIPRTALPPVHRTIVFQWSFTDDNVRVRGDGAARVAPPDSVRLDFFVANGMGSGYALLVGDSVRTPSGDAVRRYLPPVPLLWAALGRLAVPAAPDTAARVDGDTLRVEIGHDPGWRATFVDRQLGRLEVVDGGRIPQWLTRSSTGSVRYEYSRARRALQLTIERVDTVPAFDAKIWR